jgi:hypothetical protein
MRDAAHGLLVRVCSGVSGVAESVRMLVQIAQLSFDTAVYEDSSSREHYFLITTINRTRSVNFLRVT